MAKIRTLAKDTAIIAIVVAVILGLVETAIRVFSPERLQTEYTRGIPLAQVDETLGHRNNPGAEAFVSGPEFAVTYKISDQGFRDETEYKAVPAEGIVRILLVGDSFTFGAGSEYNDIWPFLLEQSLRARGLNVEIIKAGTPGYDTRQQYLSIKELVPAYSPHMVMLGFLPNDVFTNQAFSEDGEVSTQDSVLVAIKSDKKSGFQTITFLKRMLMSSDSAYTGLYLMTPRKDFFQSPPSDHLVEKLDVTKDLLMRKNSYLSDVGIPLVVVSIPQLFQVLAGAPDVDLNGVDVNIIDNELRSFAEDQSFTWIATLEGLAHEYHSKGLPLYHRFDGHFNPSGNAALAEILDEPIARLVESLEAEVNF